ncbi:MAG TPA: OmpA family protein [Planctomycetota bacterium]|nr:OmpA family protein [Planctomycetota bacterium]
MKLLFARMSLVMAGCFIAAVIAGCAPTKYELLYRSSEEQVKDLQARNLTLTSENAQLHQDKEKITTKLTSTSEAFDMQDKQRKEIEAARNSLLKKLQETTSGMPCEVAMLVNDYVITTRFSFEPGAAALNVQARSDLRKIAKAVAESFPEASFLVAGHADNTPIQASEYKTNWELSAARAFSVMLFLVTDCNIKSDKIGYAGFGEFRPIADNSTPEGREQNRRIEIIVTP